MSVPVRYRESLTERLARLIYTVLLALLYPVMPLYLLKRARKQPEYGGDWAQRFFGSTGLTPAGAARMWVHAVSVGETHAIAPLVLAWEKAHPGTEWVFTSTTPTGRETARQVFRDLPRKHHVYLPYDLPFAVNRFYRELGAQMGWLVETEWWPNLIAAAPVHGVLLSLINARVSPHTGESLLKWPRLSKPALGQLAAVVAQTAEDAHWFERVGRSADAVAGNLKFDVQPRPELLALGQSWRTRWGSAPVLLAASTREGEEPGLLTAWQTAIAKWTGPAQAKPRLLVVPRHPQRFAEVAGYFESAGFWVSRRSQDFPQPPAGDERPVVWMGDTMGEMPPYYSLADVALLGGSFEPLGGQNLIEAAACGCPLIMGPHTFNFLEAAQQAEAAGAARRVPDMAAAVSAAQDLALLAPSRQAMSAAALAFAQAHKGAAQRVAGLVKGLL